MVKTSSKLKQKKQSFTFWKIYFCQNDPPINWTYDGKTRTIPKRKGHFENDT